MRNGIRNIVFASLLLAVPASVTFAQDAPPASGSHKHYEAPAPTTAQTGPKGEVAPRLQKLGAHTFPVSTRRAAAQRFVNQGLNLAYAFNHAEARRAFREAARLDPTLASQ